MCLFGKKRDKTDKNSWNICKKVTIWKWLSIECVTFLCELFIWVVWFQGHLLKFFMKMFGVVRTGDKRALFFEDL